MSETLPVAVEPDEVMHLRLEHRGRVVMSTAVRMAAPAAIGLTVHVHHHHDGAPRIAAIGMHSTLEDVAAWVAGDGTDPQRLALADGIREGWHRRPSIADLVAVASKLDEDARAALARFHDAVTDGGETEPDPDRWTRAIGEAVREIRGRYGSMADAGPRVPGAGRREWLPPGCVAVQAEDVCGAAARIADLEHSLARTERRLAEEMARTEELRQEVEDVTRAAGRDMAGLVQESKRRSVVTPGDLAEADERAWRGGA